LEGLEITELPLSQVRLENNKLRIDSGYFAKPMLKSEVIVRNYRSGFDELGVIFKRFVKGVFDINAQAYVDVGVPFLRILNLRNGVIDDANLALIPEAIHQDEIKTEMKKGDIVLSKTAYPAASLVTLDRCNTSQDTIATSMSDYGKETYLPEALVAYLNCSVGNNLLWRQFQGNVQLHLSLDDGRKVPVPKLSLDLQKAIAQVFEQANLLSDAAVERADMAGSILIKAIGLDGWTPKEPLTYTQLSSDAFSAGRLDSEYFAPRVLELINILKKDGLTIGSVAPARHQRFIPSQTGCFNYIEIGGVHADGTAAAELVASALAPSRASQLVKEGDVITSTVRPIRRLSALISNEQDGYVCSSGFVVLEPKNILTEVLLTYLRLPMICQLLDLHSSASLYPAISERDLLTIPIPRFDANTQMNVQKNVRAAQEGRKFAKGLLKAAERAVEIAIESSDADALAFLEIARRAN
jgi:hypothetical protein